MKDADSGAGLPGLDSQLLQREIYSVSSAVEWGKQTAGVAASTRGC